MEEQHLANAHRDVAMQEDDRIKKVVDDKGYFDVLNLRLLSRLLTLANRQGLHNPSTSSPDLPQPLTP